MKFLVVTPSQLPILTPLGPKYSSLFNAPKYSLPLTRNNVIKFLKYLIGNRIMLQWE